MNGYVIRKKDGSYFMGCGYGGPRNPVPYFQHDLKQAKVYRTLAGAAKAAKNYGGHLGAVKLNEWDEPVEWLGFIVEFDGKARGWNLINVAPRDFNPEDYIVGSGKYFQGCDLRDLYKPETEQRERTEENRDGEG